MEKPMDGIINIDVNPMTSIPCKGIQYLISMDDIDKGDHFPLSSIGFDETKNRWNSRVFHTGGSDKNWNGPMSEISFQSNSNYEPLLVVIGEQGEWPLRPKGARSIE